MTELDEEIGPIAVEVIDEYGKEVIYTFSGVPEYDPETATASAEPIAPLTVKAIVEDVKGRGIGFGLIETADKKLTVAAALFPRKPTASDTFALDGSTFTVMKEGVKAIYSGDLVAVYEIKGQL
jgi:hypothetical protein